MPIAWGTGRVARSVCYTANFTYKEEKEMCENKYTNMLGGFFVGTMVGAAVALLLAPDSGVRTRRKLRRKAEDAGERVIDTGKELLDNCRELRDRAVTAIGA